MWDAKESGAKQCAGPCVGSTIDAVRLGLTEEEEPLGSDTMKGKNNNIVIVYIIICYVHKTLYRVFEHTK